MDELRDRRIECRLDQALGRQQVARGVELDVGPAPRQARHRGEMDDRRPAVEKGPDWRGPKVELVELETRALDQASEIRLLDPARVVVDEGVDADDLVAPVDERLGEVRPDKARDAGDEDPHVAEG